MPKPTASELAELRRKAYHWGPLDTIRLLETTGIPPDLCPISVAITVSGCTRTWLNKRRRDGSVPSYVVGQRVMVPLSAVVQRQAKGGKGSQRILKPAETIERQPLQGTRAR